MDEHDENMRGNLQNAQDGSIMSVEKTENRTSEMRSGRNDTSNIRTWMHMKE